MLSRAPRRRAASAALRLRRRALQTLSLSVFASGALLLGPSAWAGNTGQRVLDEQSDWLLSDAYPGATDWLGDNAGPVFDVAGFGPIVNTATTTATWTGAGTDLTWGNTGNWSGGVVPGVPGTTSTTDMSTANFAGTVTNTTPTLETSYNLQNINFGATGTTLSSYTISNSTGSTTSGNYFLLTNGGTIQLGSGVTSTGLTETINAPMVLEPGSATTIGGYTFANNIGDTASVLNIAGNISGGTTSATNGNDGNPDGGSIILTLQGTNTGRNTISGVISDGGAGSNTVERGLAVRKFGTGTWYLTGTNTFSGELEISQGTLNVASLSNYGAASAIGNRASSSDTTANGGVGILINGGILQYTGTSAQSTNRNIRLGNANNNGINTIDASGTGSGTMSFTHTGANVNLFQGTTSPNLTLTGTSTGNNMFNISLTSGVNLIKNGTGTWVLAPESVDSNGSSFSGGTTINAGTLIAGSGDLSTTVGVFGGSSRTVTLGGASGSLNASLLNAGFTVGNVITVRAGSSGAATIGGSAANTSTFSGGVTMGRATNFVAASGGTTIFSGATTGAFNATYGDATNTGTVALTGANTYSGTTTISGGTLQLGNGGTTGTLATTSAITDNGTFAINRSNAVTQGTDFSNAAITGTGGFTQAGTGITTLNAANTFTGATAINAGTLSLTGSLTSAVTVNTGGTLTGFGNGTTTGRTSQSVTAAGGSTVALTSAANSLTAASSITLGAAGGAYTNGATATGYTTLNFTLGGTSGAVEAFNTSGVLTLNSGGAFVNVASPVLGTFTLANYGSLAGSGGFSLSSTTANVTSVNLGRNTETLTANATNLTLSISGNPTPGLAYFNGGATVGSRTQWNNGSDPNFVNFSSNVQGTTDAGNVVGAVSDVILNANNAVANVGSSTITETLGASTTINSLRVNGNATTTIGADGSTLTINALADSNIVSDGTFTAGSQTAGTGIVIASGANPFTVSVPVLLGNSQSWTNNSANLFTVGGTSVGGTATAGNTQTLTLANTGAGGTLVSSVIGDGSAGGKLALVASNSGAGFTTLTGANTYTGSTTVNSGSTLQVGNGTTDGSINTSSGITDNGTLAFNLAGTGAGNTYNNVIGGTGSVTKTGAGTLTFSAANTFTGGLTVSNGVLVANTVTAVGPNATATNVAIGSAGTVDIVATVNNTTYNQTFTGSGKLKFDLNSPAGDTLLATNSVSGLTGIIELANTTNSGNKIQINGTVTTAATLQIDNQATYFTGTGTVNFGAITIVGVGNNENRGAIRLNGNGTTTAAPTTGIVGGNISLLGNTTIDDEGGALTGNISTGVAGASTLTMGTSNNAATSTALLSGNLSDGTGTLALTAAYGTTTLTGTNTYSGVTTINSGATLQLGDGTTGHDGTIAGTSGITDNGILIYNRFGATSSSRVISGTGAVTKIGNGTQTLTGANTYSGVTTVSGGTLQLGDGTSGNDGTIANSTSIVDNASLVYNRFGTTNSYGGVISGTGAVTMTGTGTQTLTGANTYTGTTAINAGTLLVNGNQTSATGNVSVASGGTLGGTGTIGGATTVATGGTITGNTSGTVGMLNFTQALTINGIYVADVIAGTGSDKLGLTTSGTAGTLTLTTTSVLNLAVSGTLSAAQYVLATYYTLSGAFSSVTGTPAGYRVDYGTVMAGAITLDAVPEPGTWLGGLLLVGTFGFSQRRRLRAWHSLRKSA